VSKSLYVATLVSLRVRRCYTVPCGSTSSFKITLNEGQLSRVGRYMDRLKHGKKYEGICSARLGRVRSLRQSGLVSQPVLAILAGLLGVLISGCLLGGVVPGRISDRRRSAKSPRRLPMPADPRQPTLHGMLLFWQIDLCHSSAFMFLIALQWLLIVSQMKLEIQMRLL
jgi:hypothetical protein